MKKQLLAFIAIFSMVGYLSAQTIVDFEDETAGPLTLHVQGSGDWDNDAIHPVNETFMVVDNPDATGINTSSKVMKFIRRGTSNGGQPWGGFWANIDPTVDVTTNKYVHVKVLKTRVSPLKFKLEGAVTLETASMNTQADVNKWVDIVFDFSTLTGEYAVLSFMPDFEDPLVITDDIDIYFDDIYISSNPNPITESIDFENGTTGPLTLHVQGCGDWDNDAIHPSTETFMVVDNPDATGINTSSKVMKFIRRGTSNGGQPWGGFWANIDPTVDVTTNKYVHVKVLKTRVSPLKFKLEGAVTLETASMNTQADVDTWVDIVFDFSTLTGEYAVLSFMPDFEDPLVITDDIDIYFDDIIFNNDPTPITTDVLEPKQMLQYSIYPNPASSEVFVSVNSEINSISIVNLIGQEVKTMQNIKMGINNLNISNLNEGIYIIRIKDKNNRIESSKLYIY
ncbi:MAG: T9SS type A sorting domain-containing protein [Salinivirgaceae bacterium]|nr:T9SS type A sorting domain-containing protein [Salinivirgaceae bacterium]